MALDPAVQRITLVDAPGVVGWSRWREIDEQHTLGSLRATIRRIGRDGRIAVDQVDILANMVLAAMSEAAMIIAGADDPAVALRSGLAALDTLLDRLSAPDRSVAGGSAFAVTSAWHDGGVTGTRDDNDWDRRQPTMTRRIVTGAGIVAAVVVLYLIGAAVIPRWWAQRVADVVDGRLTVGALFGLFIGIVFTVVPLLAAWAVIKWRTQRRTWKGWLGWLVVIAIGAAPNLMTLGIVTGNSNAAHAGDRILDVAGPGFRVWTFVGVLAGIVAVVGVIYLARSRRTSRRRATELRDELHARDNS